MDPVVRNKRAKILFELLGGEFHFRLRHQRRQTSAGYRPQVGETSVRVIVSAYLGYNKCRQKSFDVPHKANGRPTKTNRDDVRSTLAAIVLNHTDQAGSSAQ